MLRCFSCGAVQRKLNVAAFLRVEDRGDQEIRAVTLCSERSTRMARCSVSLLTCWIIIFEDFGSYGLVLLRARQVSWAGCGSAPFKHLRAPAAEQEAHSELARQPHGYLSLSYVHRYFVSYTSVEAAMP